jgi:hypothetical protein
MQPLVRRFLRRARSSAAASKPASALALALVAACAGARPAPTPGTSTGAVPDLRGARVMLFPVQTLDGVGAQADAELAFALAQRNAGVDWVLPDAMRRAGTTSPGLDIRLEGLPVGIFMQTEVRRIGDPLFGWLRRMGALVSSDIALVPVLARYRAGSAAGPDVPAAPSGVEIAAALISVRSGQVLWFGVEQGSSGSVDDPRVLASAAEAMSRRLLPIAARERE